MQKNWLLKEVLSFVTLCGELKDTFIGKIILASRNNNYTCICIFVEDAMIELKRSKQCNGYFSAEV